MLGPAWVDAGRAHSDARSPGRRVVWSAVAIAVVVLAAYVGLPQIAGLDETWGRLSEGDPWWLAVAVVLDAGSYGGYMLLFRGVLVHPDPRIGWRESYEITTSGVAATRLLATGGVGGIALTGWARARSGHAANRGAARSHDVFRRAPRRLHARARGRGCRAAERPAARPGAVRPDRGPGGLRRRRHCRRARAQPAARRGWTAASERGRRAIPAVAVAWAAAAIASGVRGAVGLVRARDPALIGALAWWGFDIGVLWACFHAFGDRPPAERLLEQERDRRETEGFRLSHLPNHQIRDLFLRRKKQDPDFSAARVAELAGLSCSSHVERELGLIATSDKVVDGVHYPGRIKTRIGVDNAEKLLRAMGLQARDIERVLDGQEL